MRYYNPYQGQYVSQFVAAPLDYLQKSLEASQTKYDKNLTDLDAAKQAAIAKGGYSTQDRAKAYNDQVMQQYEQMASQLTSTGRLEGGAGTIAKLRNNILNNPEYQAIKADEDYKTYVDKLMATEGYHQGLKKFEKNGIFTQTKAGEAFSPDWYKFTPNAAIQDDKALKTLVDSVHADAETTGIKNGELEKITDAQGNVHTYIKGTKTQWEGIKPEKLKGAIRNYLTSNPDAANSHPALVYDNEWAQMNLGRGRTVDEQTEAIFSAFPRPYSKTVDTEEMRPTPKSSKDGGSGDDEGAVPNRMAEIITKVDTQGKTHINGKDLGVLAGGGKYNEDDNTVTVGNSSTPTFIHIATTGDLAKDMNISKSMPYFDQINTLKETEADKIRDAKRREQTTATGENGVVVTAAGASDKYNAASAEGEITIDDVLKYTKKGQEIAAKAKEEGINLNDPDVAKAIVEFNDKDIKNLSIAMKEKLRGNYKITAGDEDNFIIGDDGQGYYRAFALLNKNQLEDIMPSNWIGSGGWKNLLEKGIITKTGTDKDGNEIYQVGINRRVGIDLESAVEELDYATHGTADSVRGSIKGHKAEVRDIGNIMKMKRTISRDINNIPSTDPEYTNIQEAFNNINNMPQRTAEERVAKANALIEYNNRVRAYKNGGKK